MSLTPASDNRAVHCRTGSLEIIVILFGICIIVHCRTGSLEAWDMAKLYIEDCVYCHIDSLEYNHSRSVKALYCKLVKNCKLF